jgi:hypothetical protein
MTLYDKLLCSILITYIFIEFTDMSKKLHNPKYSTLDLLLEALYKAILIGLFITLYISIVIDRSHGLII